VNEEEVDDDKYENPSEQEKVNLRLQRRDTPHHLKNKRITSEGADAEKLRQILQKVELRFFRCNDIEVYFIKLFIYLCFVSTDPTTGQC